MTTVTGPDGVGLRAPNRAERALIRAAAATLSRRGRAAALLVLIFHRVLPEPDPLLPGEPDARRFAAIVDLLQSCFAVLPLREAVQRLRDSTLPPRAACITFDDGYANNCEVAQPILSAAGLPATVFVAPGYLDGGRMFNDSIIETVRRAPPQFDLRPVGLDRYLLDGDVARRRVVDVLLGALKYLEPAERLRSIGRIVDLAGVTLPANLMMTRAQVLRLHRTGTEIGAHTLDHPILTSVDDAEALRQIGGSRVLLESIVGSPVLSFAYPNGRPGKDYSARHVGMARAAGFDLALSTAWGAATRTCDPMQVPRVAAWDCTPLRYGLRLANAYRARSFAIA